ncbi:MAG TPA: ectoine/hydroxyectoine ABC transporter substrate-binding protein EhuB, partial [Microlunatus sp.]
RSSRRGFLQAAGAAATAATGAVLLGGCGDAGGASAGGAGNGAGGRALAAKGNGQSLKVAIGNEPPYTKMNADGTVTGCEPDVLQAVLTSMGYGKVEPVVAGYDAMIAGLNAHRWDVIAAGLFMKQSRCEAVAYTEPVIVSTESFAVLPGNPKKITTVARVKSDSLIKCAVIGGGFEDGILQTAEVPTDQVVKVKDGVSGVAALKAGRCDAFLLPTLSLQSITSGGFDVTDVITDAPKTGSGAAFRKSDSDFVTAYNKALTDFKATDEFSAIEKKWGFRASDTDGVTTSELCKNEG